MKHLPPHEVRGAAVVPSGRLTTSNLRVGMDSNLTKFDKARLIETYLQSQRAYRKEFELEGKDARAMWDKENGGDIYKDQTAPSLREGVFATPILKPRVPEKTRGLKERNQLRSPSSPNKKGSRRAERQASETSGRRAVKTGRPSKEQYNPSIFRKDASDGSIGAKKEKNRALRGAAGCSDPERAELLAARRERRRTKKAIVDPGKAVKEQGMNNEKESSKSKAKKGRKNNASAGLALMHGFSATNVGAARLTIKPSLGVFTKGKASTKIGVSSKAKSKIPACAWTESLFLNNTKHNPSKVEQEPAVRDTDGSCMLTTPVDSPKPKRKRSPSTVEPAASTRSKKKYKICNHSKGSRHTKVAHSDPGDGNTASNESLQLAAMESVVWDIESSVKETTEEIRDGMKNKTSKILSPSSPRDDTLTLNTRVTNWSTGNPSIVDRRKPHLEYDHEETGRRSSDLEDLEGEKETDRMLDGSSVSHSSLCPSQSASQAIPTYNESHAVQQTIRSKYFIAPSASGDGDGVGVQVLPDEGMEVMVQNHRPTTDEEGSLRHFRESPAPSLSVYSPCDPTIDVGYLSSDIGERGQDIDNDLRWDERNLANHYNAPPLTVDPCMDLEYWQANVDQENSLYCGSSRLDMYAAEDLVPDAFETQTDCDLDLGNDYSYEPSVGWIDLGYQVGNISDRNEAMLYHSDCDYPATQPLAYEDQYVESSALFVPDDGASVPISDVEYGEVGLLFERSSQSLAYPYSLEQPCLRDYSPGSSTDSAPTEIDSTTGHLALPTLAQVEDGVAQTLQGHWRPQRL